MSGTQDEAGRAHTRLDGQQLEIQQLRDRFTPIDNRITEAQGAAVAAGRLARSAFDRADAAHDLANRAMDAAESGSRLRSTRITDEPRNAFSLAPLVGLAGPVIGAAAFFGIVWLIVSAIGGNFNSAAADSRATMTTVANGIATVQTSSMTAGVVNGFFGLASHGQVVNPVTVPDPAAAAATLRSPTAPAATPAAGDIVNSVPGTSTMNADGTCTIHYADGTKAQGTVNGRTCVRKTS